MDNHRTARPSPRNPHTTPRPQARRSAPANPLTVVAQSVESLRPEGAPPAWAELIGPEANPTQVRWHEGLDTLMGFAAPGDCHAIAAVGYGWARHLGTVTADATSWPPRSGAAAGSCTSWPAPATPPPTCEPGTRYSSTRPPPWAASPTSPGGPWAYPLRRPRTPPPNCSPVCGSATSPPTRSTETTTAADSPGPTPPGSTPPSKSPPKPASPPTPTRSSPRCAVRPTAGPGAAWRSKGHGMRGWPTSPRRRRRLDGRRHPLPLAARRTPHHRLPPAAHRPHRHPERRPAGSASPWPNSATAPPRRQSHPDWLAAGGQTTPAGPPVPAALLA